MLSSFMFILLSCSEKSTTTTDTADTGSSSDGGSDTAEIDDTGNEDTSTSNDTGEDTGAAEPQQEPLYTDSVVILDISETEGNLMDFAFLSAISASAYSNHGLPAVLAVEDTDNISPATENLLLRLQPSHAFSLESTAIPHAGQTHALSFENPAQFSIQLMETFWESTDTVVFVSHEDYSGALVASSLASLLEAPLLFSDQLSDQELDSIISEMGIESVLTVSLTGEELSLTVPHQALSGVQGVLDWLSQENRTPTYLSLTNPEDRWTGRAQKSSLVAPMYASRREGLSIPLSLSMPTEVVLPNGTHPAQAYMTELYESMGQHPEYLAIVGAHDALPQTRKASIFDNPIAEHPVSDLPYGEIDDDDFLDIAIGRVVGDTISELSAQATRSAHYEQLLDGNWEHQFVESGLWGFDELRYIMQNVGYDAPEHLSQQEISTQSTLEVGTILHKDHSYCQVLGNAFDLQTQTLFAPSIVLSRGCSVSGIDLLPSNQRSIVDHMLGLGAVAFVGASRNAIAQNTLIEISMWNHMLGGQSIGHAFKSGINDAIVHWKDENSSALRYSLDIEMLYGDPALEIYIPQAPMSEPAQYIQAENSVRVVPPQEWDLIAFHPDQLAEWNYSGNLFMYTGHGASPKTYWSGGHDREDLYFGVQVPLEITPVSIQQSSSHNTPLGWAGTYYVDQHQNGSVTALWRVRLMDYDPYTGDIVGESEEFSYTIE